MVNPIAMGKSFLIFVVASITLYVLGLIIDPIINALDSILSLNLSGMVWFFYIIITIVAIIIMPGYYFYKALIESQPKQNKIIVVPLSIILALLTILITVKGWFFVENLSTLLDIGFLQVVYWIGFAELFITWVVISPYYCISRAYQGNEV